MREHSLSIKALQSANAVLGCVREQQMKSGNALLSTPGPKRDRVCLSEHLPITSREPGSSRCLAPTAGPALLTVDKQVGVGIGLSERERKV